MKSLENNKMNFIEHIDQINKISDESKSALQSIISTKNFSKNEIIQDINTSCRTVYIVKSGCARIFYFKDGNDITNISHLKIKSLYTLKVYSQANPLRKAYKL